MHNEFDTRMGLEFSKFFRSSFEDNSYSPLAIKKETLISNSN